MACNGCHMELYGIYTRSIPPGASRIGMIVNSFAYIVLRRSVSIQGNLKMSGLELLKQLNDPAKLNSFFSQTY